MPWCDVLPGVSLQDKQLCHHGLQQVAVPLLLGLQIQKHPLHLRDSVLLSDHLTQLKVHFYTKDTQSGRPNLPNCQRMVQTTTNTKLTERERKRWTD